LPASAARFATWLARIAVHEGIRCLRARRDVAALELFDPAEEEGRFEPRVVKAWVEDAERRLAQSELRELVETALL